MTVIRNLYLTKDEAATELGVSTRTLDRWHAERVGPPRTLFGRKVLYRQAALFDWAARREQVEIRDHAA
jgi:hypothetical protein